MVDIKHVKKESIGISINKSEKLVFQHEWKLIDINQPYTHKFTKFQFSPLFLSENTIRTRCMVEKTN